MQRGDARIVVLKALSERPMHGYEVIKEISDMFGGVYAPSAGVVYPTLQWLEDESLVESSLEGEKKVYRISEAGKKFLSDGRQALDRLMEFRKKIPQERIELVKAGRDLQRTMMMSFPGISGTKAKEATKILNEAQSKLERLME
jgi:DNA-binding PadR family transcriptional regulator